MKSKIKQYLEEEIARLEKEHDKCIDQSLMGKALGISWKLEGLNYALDFVISSTKDKTGGD